MVLDYELTSDLGTELSDRGDIEVVTGAEEIRQEIVISVLENADLSAPTLTESGLESQRASIEQAVRSSDRTLEPISVSVGDIDRGSDSVEYTVQTRRVTLPLTTE